VIFSRLGVCWFCIVALVVGKRVLLGEYSLRSRETEPREARLRCSPPSVRNSLRRTLFRLPLNAATTGRRRQPLPGANSVSARKLERPSGERAELSWTTGSRARTANPPIEISIGREVRVSSKAAIPQLAPPRRGAAKRQARTAAVRTPAPTDRATISNRAARTPRPGTQSSNARSCARMRSVIPQMTCP
jgi:hypothetical protein